MKKLSLVATFAAVVLTSGFAQQDSAAIASQQGHIGLPQDWSFRHVIHSGPIVGTPENSRFNDPRAIYSALRRGRLQRGAQISGARSGKLNAQPKTGLKRDWSFTLGTTAGVADGMSPAKYTFDINATPSCANDYVLYGVNAAGSATQPTLVGFNNIYAGGAGTAKTIAASPTGAVQVLTTVTITTTAPHGFIVGQSVTVAGVGVAGFNGTQTVTAVPSTTTFQYTHAAALVPPGSGGGTATAVSGICGANPTVRWAYNTNTGTGVVRTSPVLSLDGTKVAFVESKSAGSVFHVLTLGTTPGSDGSYSAGYATVTPTSSATVGTAGTMTSYTYAASTDNTRSSPWIDYGTDTAYVADNAGNVYHVGCVFTIGCTPSTQWTKNVGAAVSLSAPVFDQTSQSVFVGASDGKVYKISPVASCPASCTVTSMVIGDGTVSGGVSDPVVLDSSFQTLFAYTGSNAGGNSTVVETGTGVGSAKAFNVALGTTVVMSGSTGIQHSPAFNDLYYGNSTLTTTPAGALFTCGPGNGSGQNFFFSTPFSNAGGGTLSISNPPVMGATTSLNLAGNAATQCSPITEINDGTTDRLFMGQYTSQANKCGTLTTGCVLSVVVTTNTPTTFNSLSEVGGTSAIVVDNVSPSSQASSIYFSTLGQQACGTGGTGFCAVKLTQAGLQ